MNNYNYLLKSLQWDHSILYKAGSIKMSIYNAF